MRQRAMYLYQSSAVDILISVHSIRRPAACKEERGRLFWRNPGRSSCGGIDSPSLELDSCQSFPSSSRWHRTRNETSSLRSLHLPQTSSHQMRQWQPPHYRSHQSMSSTAKVSKTRQRCAEYTEHRQYAPSPSSTASSVLCSPSVRSG